MQLRALAKVLIAAALASPIASAAPDAGTAVSDVAPVHDSANWQWMSIRDVLATVMPLGPDEVAHRLRSLAWAEIAGKCDASCKVTAIKADTQIAAFTKQGLGREYTFADIRKERDRYAKSVPANDPTLRAIDVLLKDKLSTLGVWISRKGNTSATIPPELLTGKLATDKHRAELYVGLYDKLIKGGDAEALIGAMPDSADRAAMRVMRRIVDRDQSGIAIEVVPLSVGWLVRAHMDPPSGGCTGGESDGHAIAVVRGSEVQMLEEVRAEHGHCRGRRPPGFAMAESSGGELSRFHAASAQLEAASIDAFELLATELELLGAPALAVRARAAADDERRHAVIERRHAGIDHAPDVAVLAPRDPFAIALDNAVEGCVHETFAALIASFQAERVGDAELAGIADDELAHGQLAWDIAAWLEPRLSDDQRRLVATAREHALDRLTASADLAATGGLVATLESRRALGLPTAMQASLLARGLRTLAA